MNFEKNKNGDGRREINRVIEGMNMAKVYVYMKVSQ
jgi:TPP-dependent pyruvate/acetoin dehydrogenase alpha subunit